LKLLKVAAWSAVLLAGSAVPVHADGFVTPYIGFNYTSLNVADTITSFSENSIGYDLGFGVNGYFTKSVGIRGDIRRFKTFQDLPRISGLSDEHLMFWRASLGLAIRF
jgi:hypothetical protein